MEYFFFFAEACKTGPEAVPAFPVKQLIPFLGKPVTQMKQFTSLLFEP
jgi:hypothetical protein